METKTENRNCQNCKQNFTIESEDFNFYEKIKVPPPTFCPECRLIRRLVWRNLRSLYKRDCGLCGRKNLISFFPNDNCPVFCIDCFNSDQWDVYSHAKEIDWSKNFLLQIYDLLQVQPRVYQFRIGTIINSDYGNAIAHSKNSYMSFSSIDNEDVIYSENIDRSRQTIDSFSVADLNQCSWNIFSNKNYNSHFILSSSSCIDSFFLYDCVNCQNCCLSSNLRNQQYVFKNQKMTKESYEFAVSNLQLHSYSGFKNAEREFDAVYKNAVHRYAQIVSSLNVTGDWVSNSKNVFKSFDISNSCVNTHYSLRLIQCKEFFDCSYAFGGEMCYDCQAVSDGTFNQAFSTYCNGSKNMRYSIFCKNSTDCFGCVGLKNAKYCILNKQYDKDQYFTIVEKLQKHMDEIPYIDDKGRIYKYGEFFPFEFSPFCYNETLALDVSPLSYEKAQEMGYPWKEKEKKSNVDLVDSRELPDSIYDTPDQILSSVMLCINNGNPDYQCTTAFKIIKDELLFYKQKGLPIPRYCPNCRHYQRLKFRNPLKLWRRSCMCEKGNHAHQGKCAVEFETSYAPERPEIVYCEKCYQSEAY